MAIKITGKDMKSAKASLILGKMMRIVSYISKG